MRKIVVAFISIVLLSHFTNAQTSKKQVAAATKPAAQTSAPSQQTVAPTPAEKTPDEGKDVVAIYHFTTAREFSYDYAVGMGNAVEAGFIRSTRFTVVERNRFGLIKDEEKFREANTTDIVNKASKFGAKVIVTGHIVSVSQGDLTYEGKPTGEKFAEISLSFKIIDVQTGEVKLSQIINGKGEGKTNAEAMTNSYVAIDNLVRRHIGAFMPQKFKIMSIVSKTTKRKKEYLDKFKIWGGSDNGINVGDAVHIYTLSYLVNPNTGKQIEEKKLLAYGNIIEINSGQTATVSVTNTAEISKYKDEILAAFMGDTEKLIVEYKGDYHVKASFLDIFR
jgi:curli biogenesis system outer membrane secretion channel CsgG